MQYSIYVYIKWLLYIHIFICAWGMPVSSDHFNYTPDFHMKRFHCAWASSVSGCNKFGFGFIELSVRSSPSEIFVKVIQNICYSACLDKYFEIFTRVNSTPPSSLHTHPFPPPLVQNILINVRILRSKSSVRFIYSCYNKDTCWYYEIMKAVAPHIWSSIEFRWTITKASFKKSLTPFNPWHYTIMSFLQSLLTLSCLSETNQSKPNKKPSMNN